METLQREHLYRKSHLLGVSEGGPVFSDPTGVKLQQTPQVYFPLTMVSCQNKEEDRGQSEFMVKAHSGQLSRLRGKDGA